MPIATRCPTCGKDYQLADEQAGLRVRCRACQNEFDVPRRAEQLEAVATMPRRPMAIDETDALKRSVPRTAAPAATGNRTLLYVLGILGACFVVAVLACAGLIWMLTMQVSRTVDQVAKELDKTQVAVHREAPKPEKPREVAKVKEVEAPLPTIKLPTGPAIKDLDDAVQKLRSPEQLTRLRALEYIGKQTPPTDAARKKAVMDAVNPLTNDEDVFVKLAATQVKLLWEFD